MNNTLPIEKKIESHEKQMYERSEKLENKKQRLLKQLEEKKQKKEYILNTKLALKNEKNNRKAAQVNVRQLDKANETYKESLMDVQTQLDNEIFKLATTKNALNKEVQQTQLIENKVKEIEQEREKTTKDNQELQSILENKQHDIINTVQELNNLNEKASKDYDKLLEKRNEMQLKIKELSELKVPKVTEDSSEKPNKAIEQFLLNSKHKENIRMKKYDEKKKQFFEKQERLKEIKQTKLALKNEQLTRKGKKSNVSALEKSNHIYSDKLVKNEQHLSNDLLKLEHNKKQMEDAIQIKKNIEEEIKRIEQERQIVNEDNKVIEEFLVNNKTTIQHALKEVNDLKTKANVEYLISQQEKKRNADERKQSQLKLALLKKYA